MCSSKLKKCLFSCGNFLITVLVIVNIIYTFLFINEPYHLFGNEIFTGFNHSCIELNTTQHSVYFNFMSIQAQIANYICLIWIIIAGITFSMIGIIPCLTIEKKYQWMNYPFYAYICFYIFVLIACSIFSLMYIIIIPIIQIIMDSIFLPKIYHQLNTLCQQYKIITLVCSAVQLIMVFVNVILNFACNCEDIEDQGAGDVSDFCSNFLKGITNPINYFTSGNLFVDICSLFNIIPEKYRVPFIQVAAPIIVFTQQILLIVNVIKFGNITEYILISINGLLLILIIWCFAYLKNATLVQNEEINIELGFRYCRACKKFKTAGMHHCKICQKCTVGMDHHCGLINNCIGEANIKSFILLLIYTSFYLLIQIIHSIFVTNELIKNGAEPWQIPIAILWLFEIFMYLLVAGLACFRLYLLLLEITLIDYVKMRRILDSTDRQIPYEQKDSKCCIKPIIATIPPPFDPLRGNVNHRSENLNDRIFYNSQPFDNKWWLWWTPYKL